MSTSASELRYEPLERLVVPRPVNRLAYVAELCRGRDVLDLGAMDETAHAAKFGRGTWLHERIAKVAKRVVGVDNSSLVPEAGLVTFPNARIIRGDVMRLAEWLEAQDFEPDVVVAGELIEHVESPLTFLRGLAATATLRGRTLVLTTPNATACHNLAVGLVSRESTHVDHLCILSYKTLNTLCKRAGFASWEIIPYRAAFTEMRTRNRGPYRVAIVAGECIVNGIEWLFPLLSFGYIVRVTI